MRGNLTASISKPELYNSEMSRVSEEITVFYDEFRTKTAACTGYLTKVPTNKDFFAVSDQQGILKSKRNRVNRVFFSDSSATIISHKSRKTSFEPGRGSHRPQGNQNFARHAQMHRTYAQ